LQSKVQRITKKKKQITAKITKQIATAGQQQQSNTK